MHTHHLTNQQSLSDVRNDSSVISRHVGDEREEEEKEGECIRSVEERVALSQGSFKGAQEKRKNLN